METTKPLPKSTGNPVFAPNLTKPTAPWSWNAFSFPNPNDISSSSSKFNSGAFVSACASSFVASSLSSNQQPTQQQEWGQYLANKLHRFCRHHEVYVYSRSQDQTVSQSVSNQNQFTINVTTMRARIDSIVFDENPKNEENKQSKLSIFVIPPPFIQSMFDINPKPDCLHNVSIQEREIMHLATYMSIVLSLGQSGPIRMYDDVECNIVWHVPITSSATFVPPQTTLSLSSFIPTCVLFGQDVHRLRRYGHYLDALMIDPMYIGIFQSRSFSEFYSCVNEEKEDKKETEKGGGMEEEVKKGDRMEEDVKEEPVSEFVNANPTFVQSDIGVQTEPNRCESDTKTEMINLIAPIDMPRNKRKRPPKVSRRVLRPRVVTLKRRKLM